MCRSFPVLSASPTVARRGEKIPGQYLLLYFYEYLGLNRKGVELATKYERFESYVLFADVSSCHCNQRQIHGFS